MEFRKVLVFRGPNIWANFAGSRGLGRSGRLEDRPSTDFPGFNERLMGWLPTMIEHRCSIGERGGFFERLRARDLSGATSSNTSRWSCKPWPGIDVGFGRARETSRAGSLQGGHRI